jgi:hypothetical protein
MTPRSASPWTRAVTWVLGGLAAAGVVQIALWLYRVNRYPVQGASPALEGAFLGGVAVAVFIAWRQWLQDPTPGRVARLSQELGIRLVRRARLGAKDAIVGYLTGYEGEYRGSRVRLDIGRRGLATRFRLHHGRTLEFELHCAFNVSWLDPAGEVSLGEPTLDVGDPTLRCAASDEERGRALLRSEPVREAVRALRTALAELDGEAGFVLGHEAVTVFSYHEPPGKAVVDAMRALSTACAPQPPRRARARAG